MIRLSRPSDLQKVTWPKQPGEGDDSVRRRVDQVAESGFIFRIVDPLDHSTDALTALRLVASPC